MGTMKNTEKCLRACSFILEKAGSYSRKKKEKKETGMDVVGKRFGDLREEKFCIWGQLAYVEDTEKEK